MVFSLNYLLFIFDHFSCKCYELPAWSSLAWEESSLVNTLCINLHYPGTVGTFTICRVERYLTGEGMKPLTCQFATGYSLYHLPHSASVTELSLRLRIKAHEANISVSTAYLQLGIWKLISHLEYVHFIHYTYFHAVAMLNLTTLPGYISAHPLYFTSKIGFLTSRLTCLQYFLFLFCLL